MRLGARHGLLVAGAVLLLTPAATSAATTAVHPAAAARSCAHGRSLSSQLGVRDVGFLKRFVPCVLRTERAELGLSYTSNRLLSRGVKIGLAKMVKLSYLADHNRQAANRTGILIGKAIVAVYCRRQHKTRGLFQVSWANSGRPGLTPIGVTRYLSEMFKHSNAVARSPLAAFGTGAGRGLLFDGNNLNGASLGAIVVTCQ